MADHYQAAIEHRATAIETRKQLRALHDQADESGRVRRLIGQKYDALRHSLKLAEIDALLSIGQGLRDVVTAIEGRR